MISSTKNLSSLAFSFLLVLQACAPGLPKGKDKPAPLPSVYANSEDTKETASAAEIQWSDFFEDPELKELIGQALATNQDLRLIEQEVNIANNEIMARKGELFPKVNANASGGVTKLERFSTEDANSHTRQSMYGVSATWEVDVWKKLRNATKSAYFRYLSSVEGRHLAVTNLVAEVARTYYELLALDNQLKIVTTYVDIITQVREMVSLQMQAGRTTSLGVKRFEGELYKIQAKKLAIEQQVVIKQNELNVLLGRYPQPIARGPEKFEKFIYAKMNTSVPAKLLEQRPDVKQAMLDLEAAKLDVDVARARFYPSLSIDAEAGYESFNSKHFSGTTTASFYSILGNLTMPLLNRQSIKADYYTANNKQIQAVYNYELALVRAYADVSNQLIKLENLNKIYDLKAKQVATLDEAIDISNMLFRAARVDYIESLFTQRDALEAKLELIEVKKEQLTASVDLYRALGGGWKGLKETAESNY